MKLCENCKRSIVGRSDKKFCTHHCRSAFHNMQRLIKKNTYQNYIDSRMKKNRNILKEVHQIYGDAEIGYDILITKGLDFLLITHFVTLFKDQTCRFCYDYGYCDVGNKVQIICQEIKT